MESSRRGTCQNNFLWIGNQPTFTSSPRSCLVIGDRLQSLDHSGGLTSTGKGDCGALAARSQVGLRSGDAEVELGRLSIARVWGSNGGR